MGILDLQNLRSFGKILQHQAKRSFTVQETGFAQVMSWYTDCTSIYKFLWQNCIPKIVTKPDAIEMYTYPAMILSIHIMCMACLLVLSSMAALVITNLYKDTLKLKNKKKSAEHTGSIVLFTACMMFLGNIIHHTEQKKKKKKHTGGHEQ